MGIIKRRMLEGHSVGIDEHYCKPSEEDLQEEYMKAADNLTINEENRLRRKVEKLEVEKTQIEALALELEKVKKAIKKKRLGYKILVSFVKILLYFFKQFEEFPIFA
jgi:hypothetical protein